MKALLLIFATLTIAGCNGDLNSLIKSNETTAISVVKDDTDSALTKPDSQEIIGLFNINDKSLHNGYQFRERSIGNTSLNHVQQYKVPPTTYVASDDNSRIAELKAFKRVVIGYIDSLVNAPTKPTKNSLVYETISSELQNLVASNANNKIMVIYSDLLENSPEFSFYKKSDMVLAQTNPQAVVGRFEKMTPMPNLTGVKIYIINKPHTLQDERNLNCSVAIFKILVQNKHGEVILASNITQ